MSVELCSNRLHPLTPENMVEVRDHGKVYSRCRLCGQGQPRVHDSEAARNYYEANKEVILGKQREVSRQQTKRKQADREKQLKAQDYRCANPGCGKELPSGGGHSDHNHKTGKKRGVLCGGCNIALGHVNDSVSKLLGLVQYLQFHAENPEYYIEGSLVDAKELHS